MKIDFELEGEYIELIKLLKATGLADNGGEAQAQVTEGLVSLNGQVDTRKRAKVRKGDVVQMAKTTIQIV